MEESNDDGARNPAHPESQSTARSCLTCHRRKVRCDKQLPCSNCVRTDAWCAYPEESGRRKVTRIPVSAVLSRLEKLERRVSRLTEELERSRYAISAVPERPKRTRSPEREIVLNGGAESRYYSDGVYASFIEEAEKIQPCHQPASENGSESYLLPGSSAWLLGATPSAPSHSSSPSALFPEGDFPTQWQALQLWQSFLSNVDPLIKVLHKDTTQREIYVALQDMKQADGSMKLLLSAIFFAAVMSLDPLTVSALLGYEKQEVLRQYKHCVEWAISISNVMTNPCLRSMQALTIYVNCLRAYDNSRNVWTLTGSAIRIAHSMGLHRDGSNLGLPAFETEMRRRAWWHLAILDSRSPEDHGLGPTGIAPSCDTKHPLNIDDCDLSPGMQKLPEPREQWTDMTFSLIMIETCDQLFRKSLENPDDGIQETAEKIQQCNTRVHNTFLKYDQTHAPVQQAGRAICLGAIEKAKFILQLRAVQHGDPSQRRKQRFECLPQACAMLEVYLTFQRNPINRGFIWLLRAYSQWFAFALVLDWLSVNPNVDEAKDVWRLANDMMTFMQDEEAARTRGTMWIALKLLYSKALQQSHALCGALAPDHPGSFVTPEIDLFGGTAGMDDFIVAANGDMITFDELLNCPELSSLDEYS